MITIYSKHPCGYCDSARALLKSRGIQFEERKLGLDFDVEFIKSNYPGIKTFPVIVSEGVLVGGFTELQAQINEQGEHFGKTFLAE